MNPSARHRVVHSLSLSVLQRQVSELLNEGWITIGTPSLAQPLDRSCPACWVQTLYLRAVPEPGLPAFPSPSQARPD